MDNIVNVDRPWVSTTYSDESPLTVDEEDDVEGAGTTKKKKRFG